MTFYEEFGITQRATEAEIRRAYKRLTLLLHPDQQQDPEMRSLAEGQMRRLNEMVAILTDPERRRAYDLSLRSNALIVRQMPPMPRGFWFRNNVGWILVGVAFLVFVASAIVIPNLDPARPVANVQNQVTQPAHPESIGKAPESVGSTERIHPAASVSISARSPSDRPPANDKWRVSPDLPSPKAPAPAAAHSEVRPLPTPPEAAPPVPSVPAAVSFPVPVIKNNPVEKPTLVGRWVYTPDPSDSMDPKLFPAEYVEISIVLVEGRLRGSYRSHYKVPDRNLSPDANFTFSGPVNEGLFAWRNDSGSKGEITLHLQSRDTLKAKWVATEMGPGLSLGAGNAVLYRFR